MHESLHQGAEGEGVFAGAQGGAILVDCQMKSWGLCADVLPALIG